VAAAYQCPHGATVGSQVWPLLANLESRSHELETYPLLLQSMECEYEQKIIKDLARTFPMHPLFKDKSGVGQQKMFNVLKAYAVFDPSLGYCQVKHCCRSYCCLRYAQQTRPCVAVRR
jgi:hypothetical protein